MKKIITILLIVLAAKVNAQDSIKVNPFTISGYLEMYYSYDFGQPENHVKPPFLYSFNRHNEVNLNIGFIKANYSTDKLRANLAFMAGTYPQYNLSAESASIQNVFEANAGFKICTTKNIWIDAGIMSSHIGFESAIGKDCWNLTRSILAENSPYYESGVKLGYTSDNGKLYLAFMYLNGWQKVQRIDYNQTPAFGTQLTFKPNANTTLNWSTYIGNEQPDSNRLNRYFNNFYGQFQLSDKFGLTAGFDIGYQQKSYESSDMNMWFSPVFIARYSLNEKANLSFRAEYYQDENGVIIATGTEHGFKTTGYSLNLDYLIQKNLLFRIEARNFMSEDDIFIEDNEAVSSNTAFTTSLSFSF